MSPAPQPTRSGELAFAANFTSPNRKHFVPHFVVNFVESVRNSTTFPTRFPTKEKTPASFFGLLLLLTTASLFAQTPSLPKPPPILPPLPPPPINFREVLAMKPAERQKVLATRSAGQRKVIEAKLCEYEALPAAEREARLCTLALRLYLRPLMELPLSNRVDRLSTIPQPDRNLIEERLQFWDNLEPQVQKEFLTNEWVLRFITAPPVPTANLSPILRSKIEKAVGDWNQLAEPARSEILKNFQALFEFSAKQKVRILDEYSDTERKRMEQSLHNFERLDKAQRERCVNGFRKFAGLTVQEREQFLGNVESWEAMSAEDRKAWRALVNRISIPSPPVPSGANHPIPAAPVFKATTVADTNN